MLKIPVIALLLMLIITMQRYDDPGIPPGGDPDIDEVPLDNSLWLLILTGGLYGVCKNQRSENIGETLNR
ncbi:MAG: hypothetical protein EOO88_05005 [Pedobacter sp.]|nr:MAG: hypothetical protein EOO88_05005 [Pedobacter sp.]